MTGTNPHQYDGLTTVVHATPRTGGEPIPSTGENARAANLSGYWNFNPEKNDVLPEMDDRQIELAVDAWNSRAKNPYCIVGRNGLIALIVVIGAAYGSLSRFNREQRGVRLTMPRRISRSGASITIYIDLDGSVFHIDE